ncbi:MAG TPA: RluA family pseudouridine synthase [Bacillota bacterium]|nr:RluA family pseudouridine synthase [Bacillota bacterium]
MQKKYPVRLSENRIFVDAYMSQQLGFSSRQIKKLFKGKKVCINGKPAYRDNKLKDGDILEVDLFVEAREDIVPEDIKLDIIYEDEYLLAVNKPPYMLVHPTPNHPGRTLLNAAAYYFAGKGEEVSLRLLNRLDMNTSGIVVMPKNGLVHGRLDEMMRSGGVRKFYTAVIEGIAAPEKGVIDRPIGKDESDPIKRKVKSDGQPAVTKYDTLKTGKSHSLVRLELVTGRTHQIRVHLSFLGHPIVGDTLYGKKSCLIGRQALHASDMELAHPVTGNLLKLHAEFPEDIRLLASRLELE